jgi:hypothetical protein
VREVERVRLLEAERERAAFRALGLEHLLDRDRTHSRGLRHERDDGWNHGL